MTCRYDREAGDYLIDGEPCRIDEFGDPTRHCTMRTCSEHVGWGEVTCARCIGRTRGHLRRIAERAALALPAAVEAARIDSAAVTLAGPAASPVVAAERRAAMMAHLDTWTMHGRITEDQHAAALANMPDDDELHPYAVLGRWEMMIREDYGQPSDKPISIAGAAAYLESQLGRIAQDQDQDFPLFAREIRKCFRHLSQVLNVLPVKERGAPCPDCVDQERRAERMVRVYGHWCDSETCEKVHYADDSGDMWVCPVDRSHKRTVAEYEKWIEQRKGKAAS